MARRETRRVRGSGAHAMIRARMRAVVMGGSALGSSKKTPRIGPLIESSASSSSKPLLLRYVGVTRVLIDSEYCRLQSRKSATLLVSSHTPMQSSRMFASSPASLSSAQRWYASASTSPSPLSGSVSTCDMSLAPRVYESHRRAALPRSGAGVAAGTASGGACCAAAAAMAYPQSAPPAEANRAAVVTAVRRSAAAGQTACSQGRASSQTPSMSGREAGSMTSTPSRSRKSISAEGSVLKLGGGTFEQPVEKMSSVVEKPRCGCLCELYTRL
mmetsp:Transcript_19563/g.64701  ORF Transcript_19563/g.64701 Transcript_19563/m.64701 type:complete len:272 (+) Transcript_19563:120-935(+)